eukprot:scaffold219832_cov19-Prasinocladus_malaysianus.AAC.1
MAVINLQRSTGGPARKPCGRQLLCTYGIECDDGRVAAKGDYYTPRVDLLSLSMAGRRLGFIGKLRDERRPFASTRLNAVTFGRHKDIE